jgi:hypothetical protein
VAAACLKNEGNLPLRLMFQDEARFGRMSDPRSCWAPAPYRPVVNLALVREFRYEYAAVSPWDGSLDFMTAEKMNTENMSRFLDQVSKAHMNQFIVMVVDGASSHRSKDLEIPKNVSFIRLPPYSPDLNPAEKYGTYSDAITSPIASLMPRMLLQLKPNSACQRWQRISQHSGS